MQASEIKVSVILPVYNVENFLSECLESIINQTLQEIEIICVNDGSTDKSLNILKEYAVIDQRIIILNQENAGAGAARNNGLSIARGNYLSFLDSDDFFEVNMLEEAYIKCKQCDADFVVFRSDLYDNETRKFSPCMWTIKDGLLPDKNIFNYKDIQKDIFKLFNGWAWDKLYKKDFVNKNNLYFQQQRTTNDLYFVFSALVCADRITISQKILAHHRKSISASLSVTREKSWQCFYFALIALRDKLKEIGIYSDIEQSYINYALHFSLWNLNTIQGITYEKLYNKLRDEYFNELGISAWPIEFFYHEGEYDQYIQIKELPMVVYLLNEISAYKNKISIISKARTVFDQRSYKIGRGITFIPRMIIGFLQSYSKHGLKYSLRCGMYVIKNRLRSKKK